MPAFSSIVYDLLQSEIKIAHRKMSRHVPYEVTHADFLEMAVAPELREMASRAPYELLLPYHHSVNVDLTFVSKDELYVAKATAVSRGSKLAPCLPRTPHPFVSSCAAGEKIGEWGESQLAISKTAGVARATLETLQDCCGSEQQLRFFLPTVMILVDAAGSLDHIATRLRSPKTPRHLPSLPRWVREGCTDTARFLAGVSMLPEAAPNHEREVELQMAQLNRFDYHGTAILPMYFD